MENMSLDEIIKTKKNSKVSSKKQITKVNKPSLKKTLKKKTISKKAAPITDARFKIIEKNRAKIRDARDKLTEITRKNGDVRKKLNQKLPQKKLQNQKSGNSKPHKSNNIRKTQVGGVGSSFRGGIVVNKLPRDRVGPMKRHIGFKQPLSAPYFQGPKEVLAIPRGYVDYDNMEKIEEEKYAAATRLSRTIRNERGYKLPPTDVYEMPVRARHERLRSPNSPPAPARGILGTKSLRERNPEPYRRRIVPEHSSHLSHEMRNRLERAPDSHASMGILSKRMGPTSSSSLPKTSSSSLGYRIVVSNMNSSVTESDLKELFEYIGELYDSRIVRPGVAEVIFKSLSDAEKAVDTYHNRELDGQPMKCLLVNPKASHKPTPTEDKRLLRIDIDTIHKGLFRRH